MDNSFAENDPFCRKYLSLNEKIVLKFSIDLGKAVRELLTYCWDYFILFYQFALVHIIKSRDVPYKSLKCLKF